ncbi:MAG: hypothetical protein DBX47_02675 [Clostridiales bacterium]|nr:MAG: hypothetical protein DBX47_02675 [Clostridiales bacterium]
MLNEKSAVFRLIHEEPNTMSSWVVGPYMKVENAGQNIKMLEYHKGSLEQRISYNAKFGASGMNVAIILDKDSPILKFRCECDFRELGDPSKSTPQFSFYMPLGFECDNYLYDIPFGTIKRKPMLYDVPALSFAYAKNGDSGVMLVTKTKYAFVCQKNSMALTLIRNSTAPDTLPDAGMHIMEFGVALTGGSEKDLVGFAYDYNHPFVFAPTKTGKGSLEKSGTFISDVSENIFIYSIKTPENGENAIIVRVCELNGKSGNVSLKLGKKPVYATLCDLSENETLPIKSEDNKIIFNAEAYSVYSILIKF